MMSLRVVFPIVGSLGSLFWSIFTGTSPMATKGAVAGPMFRIRKGRDRASYPDTICPSTIVGQSCDGSYSPFGCFRSSQCRFLGYQRFASRSPGLAPFRSFRGAKVKGLLIVLRVLQQPVKKSSEVCLLCPSGEANEERPEVAVFLLLEPLINPSQRPGLCPTNIFIG